MKYERHYCFHNFLRVRLVASRSIYIDYFDREYKEMAIDRRADDGPPDIILRIGGVEEELLPDADLRITRNFNNVLSLTYAVSNLFDALTTIWVQDHPATRLAPAFIIPVIHASILEPVMYVKAIRQDLLILHSASLSYGQNGLLVAAYGGTGKTSTVMRLLRHSSDWRFLGDDLVFVAGDRTAYNYPRPLHLFPNHLKDLPFLALSKRHRIEIFLKNTLRTLMEFLYREKFFLATRVDAREALPNVTVASTAKVSALFLLQKSGPSERVDRNSPEALDRFVDGLLETSDLRHVAYRWLFPEAPAALQEKERELARRLVAQIPEVWRFNREDVARNYEQIVQLVDRDHAHEPDH